MSNSFYEPGRYVQASTICCGAIAFRCKHCIEGRAGGGQMRGYALVRVCRCGKESERVSEFYPNPGALERDVILDEVKWLGGRVPQYWRHFRSQLAGR